MRRFATDTRVGGACGCTSNVDMTDSWSVPHGVSVMEASGSAASPMMMLAVGRAAPAAKMRSIRSLGDVGPGFHTPCSCGRAEGHVIPGFTSGSGYTVR